jgi:hypothetical protein
MVEITTTRVLCPSCAAARAAAKTRAASGGAVRAGEPKARDASGPVSTNSIPAKKVQARPEPAAPRQKPAPAAAAHATPAAPSPRQDGHLPKAQARSPQPPPARPKKKRIDVESLESHNLRKRGTREVLISFGVALVIFGVAGLVLWRVLGEKAAEKAERDRIQAGIDAFANRFRSIEIGTEDGARELIAYGEDNKAIWADLDALGTEVIGRTAKAKEYLERLASQRELIQRLEKIEQVMARAAELPPSELAEQLRLMDELRPKALIVGTEFESRLDEDRADGERVHMERLIATAEAAAAATPLDRAALTTLQQCEDDVHRIFEGVYRLWDKNRQDQALAEKKTDYEQKYKHAIELSDDAVERFFTPEVVEALPWRDLLADAGAWKTGELKGYEHNFQNGTLHLIGPDPSVDGQAILSIGDKEVWRDFVVEMEVTLLSGYCELFFRLSPVWQKNVESRELTTDEGHMEAGRTYTYVFSAIASTLVEEDRSEDSSGPRRDRISWTQIRRGGFGISVPKGTELKFTKLRAKVLR